MSFLKIFHIHQLTQKHLFSVSRKYVLPKSCQVTNALKVKIMFMACLGKDFQTISLKSPFKEEITKPTQEITANKARQSKLTLKEIST